MALASVTYVVERCLMHQIVSGLIPGQDTCKVAGYIPYGGSAGGS